jgi:orotidine-5'-phosphate decarboxylase
MTKSKIIVALDVPSKTEALKLVKDLSGQTSFFKVGLQLYTAEGPAFVRELIENGAKIFLDLKLHDIPNTVARAIEAANSLGVKMLTIHLSGGSAMVRAAATASRQEMMLLGVTLLTSLSQHSLGEIGINDKIDNQVARLARLGVAAGINGLVASPLETRKLRELFPHNISIVTPGVRPEWSDIGDQQRTTTPRQAIDAGADYLVIGRPITAAKNPHEALAKIIDELDLG